MRSEPPHDFAVWNLRCETVEENRLRNRGWLLLDCRVFIGNFDNLETSALPALGAYFDSFVIFGEADQIKRLNLPAVIERNPVRR